MRPKYITCGKEAWACLLLVAATLNACSPAPTPVAKAPRDPTTKAWYAAATKELESLTRRAERLNGEGKADQASPLIEQGENIAARLIAVPRPTLQVAELASDLDDLYGRMLLKNRHYGWARLQFQKNLARWKHWRPETAETGLRFEAAKAAIEDTDRQMEKGR